MGNVKVVTLVNANFTCNGNLTRQIRKPSYGSLWKGILAVLMVGYLLDSGGV